MRVWINNRNRLSPVKAMLTDLARMGADVEIIDNASTYPPLLDWYIHCPVPVRQLKVNIGPRAPWIEQVMKNVPNGEFYCCCDADLDLSRCPDDLLSLLAAGLRQYPDICKAGPGIEINDVPKDSPLYGHITEAESRFWTDRKDEYFWKAEIDTTFAMYRAGEKACLYGPALRADRPYVVRHLPYYLLPGTISAEERFYIESVPKHLKCGLYWTTLCQDNLEMFDGQVEST